MAFKEKVEFPDIYRVFCDGELSISVERNGGIDEIALIEGPVKDGIFYPDQLPRLLVSRLGKTSVGRPLFEPAIRFISETDSGRMIRHWAHSPEFFPWGCRGSDTEQSYEVFIDRGRILFKCGCESGKNLSFILGKNHLFCTEGETFYNDFAPLETKRGVGNDTIPSGRFRICWGKQYFDQGRNSLVLEAVFAMPSETKKLYFVISSDASLFFEENDSELVLRSMWSGKKSIHYAISVRYHLEDALREAAVACSAYDKIFAGKIRHYSDLEDSVPKLNIDGMPLIETFMKAAASYLESLKIMDGNGIRAATHKYGYFAMWDTIYPIRDLLWNGQYEDAKKVMRFIVNFPYIETRSVTSSQIIIAFDELRSYLCDREFIDELIPRLKSIFNAMLKQIDPATGLIFGGSCAVDNNAELGFDDRFHPACCNGFWYDACRVMENIGLETDDPALSNSAREIIEMLDVNYQKAFFDDKEGFLRAGCNKGMTSPDKDVFHNSATIGADYLFGAYLFRNIQNKLSDYFCTRLYHRMGHTAVACDSLVPCDMWKAVHMNQHLGHECKLFRLADNAEEAYRTIKAYLSVFEQYKVAQETFNLAVCEQNVTQTVNWQAFSATSACEAIRHGLCGIGRHRGGFYYIPAHDDHRITMDNIRFFDKTFAIRISGTGSFGTIKINGTSIDGSLQIPVDMFPGGNQFELDIMRTVPPSDRPVLLNAFDQGISDLNSKAKRLSFRLDQKSHSPVLIYSPVKPSVEINGLALKNFEWDEATHKAWIDSTWEKKDEVTVFFE